MLLEKCIFVVGFYYYSTHNLDKYKLMEKQDMKKKSLFLWLIGLLLIFSNFFVACDKKNTVKITIYINNTSYTIERNKGDNLIGLDLEALTNPEGRIYFGSSLYNGLFYDESCLFKYDQSQQIEHDITLYGFRFDGVNPNYTYVTFVFEKNEYRLNPQFNYPVTVFDFIATAYGKPISPACLEFYSDEAMTNQFELTGLNYQAECEPRPIIWAYGPPYSYTIYVKRVPAPSLSSLN